MVEHFYVKFGDPSCVVFQISREKTDKLINAAEIPTPATAVGAWVMK